MNHSSNQNINHDASQNVFGLYQSLKFGELHIKQNKTLGLTAIIAIHSTKFGPALGGCRFIAYDSLNDAVVDALRLAHGMSYKAAVNQLPLGGGKAVLIHPPEITDRKLIFHEFAKFLSTFSGRFITAEDSGTSVDDMDIIKSVCPYVVGDSSQPLTVKDPSILTALGVRRGIEAAIKFKLQRDSLEGIRIAIQGLGHVGYHLCKELSEQGAQLFITDHHAERMMRCQDEFNAQTVLSTEIHRVPCDVFSPCALGSAINANNINEIQAKIIAGSANNQLESPQMGQQLMQRDILYAPDYVINAGGLIHVSAPFQKKSEQQAKQTVLDIYETLLMIFEKSRTENQPTHRIADDIAEQRLYSS